MSPAFTLLPAPGLPLDILQGDWWVPGSTSRADLAKYSGKAQWQEILQVTPDVCLMWARRATQDHIRFLLGFSRQNDNRYIIGNSIGAPLQ